MRDFRQTRNRLINSGWNIFIYFFFLYFYTETRGIDEGSAYDTLRVSDWTFRVHVHNKKKKYPPSYRRITFYAVSRPGRISFKQTCLGNDKLDWSTIYMLIIRICVHAISGAGQRSARGHNVIRKRKRAKEKKRKKMIDRGDTIESYTQCVP